MHYQSHDTNMWELHSSDIIKMAHVQTIVQKTQDNNSALELASYI